MKKLALLACFALLAGCQTPPSIFVISPDHELRVAPVSQPTVSLEIQDPRLQRHVLRVMRSDTTTKVPQPELINALQRRFENAMRQARWSVDGSSYNQVRITVQQMEMVVRQELTGYRAEGVIEFVVKATKNDNTFRKTYGGNNNSYGKLTYDQAVIEREFDALLNQVVDRIISDPELNNFLQY